MSTRLAHFGTFDVDNYGDLLFPLLLEHRLAGVVERFVHVSPAGGAPVWGDCRPTIGIDELLAGDAVFDAACVGGGHTVHGRPTRLAAYRGAPSPGVAYPALWMVPAYLARREGLRLWWNAPGVPGDFAPRAAAALRSAVSAADYVAVRDAWSAERLAEAGVEAPVEVVPDTALEVASLWPRAELEAAYAHAFASRGATVPPRTLAFHANQRYLTGEPAAVAARIARLCEARQAVPVLLALGPCHGDAQLQAEIARYLGGALLVDRPASLREITGCIACSAGYVGSSLHGMITALAFHRPGLVVAAEESAGFRKFSGLLEPLGLGDRLCGTWEEAEAAAPRLLEPDGPRLGAALEPGLARLDRHWQRVHEVLAAPAPAAGSGRWTGRWRRLLRLPPPGARWPASAVVGEVLAEEVQLGIDQVTELRRDLRRSERRVRRTEEELLSERRQRKELQAAAAAPAEPLPNEQSAERTTD